MRTSFYFVLWILIYPLLGMINNAFILNNSFFVALLIVWGVSWWLNRAMPHTLQYERMTRVAPILEEIYTGNVRAFRKRLTRDMSVESITALYFCITAVVVIISALKGDTGDWLALIIFAFFAFVAVTRSVQLINAWYSLKADPTPSRCREIVEKTYRIPYAKFYERRKNGTYADVLPPRPKYFRWFQIFSLIGAVAAFLLGMIYIISSIAGMMGRSSFIINAISGMYFLYGSLAAYFGIKDAVSIIGSL